jgi:RNA polymerase sigma-70 factor (ECF subfamily)
MAASNELDSAAVAGEPADAALVTALRAGDEAAFRGLVQRHHAALVRLARACVSSHAVAEEVAQETWLAAIQGIDGFEGRSSLKSWIFAILVNRARSRGVREKRIVPISSLGAEGDDGPAVDADRFVAAGQRWGGHWCSPPVPRQGPAERLIAKETLRVVADVIEQLPARQRAVVSLRDIEGWTPEEVCELLELSEGNQRVLLHRGRARVRAALEDHLGGGD